MQTVHINQATEAQIRALLGIEGEDVARILAARPFDDPERLRALVPEAARDRLMGLELPKLDINTVDPARLGALAGLSPEQVARVVERRPIHVLYELVGLAGIDAAAFGKIISLFGVAGTEYVDKLTGRTVKLTATPEEVVVKLRDTERADSSGLERTLGLVRRGRRKGRYSLFRVPQTEAPARLLADLRTSAEVEVALPAYRDATGARRHLDPEFCMIQFQDGVDPAQQALVLQRAGLVLETRHRSPGLVTARLPGPPDIRSLLRVIGLLNAEPTVKFAEPAYLGLEDLERGEEGAAADPLPAVEVPWHLRLLHAPQAWEQTRGHPDVVVAVIDTGIDGRHPVLADRLLSRAADESWNFEDDFDPEPTDEDGHGTFIAGLLVGNDSTGVLGVCPGCWLLPLRIPLFGDPSSYARRRDAILYAIEKIKAPQRLIINLSWKTSGDVSMIRDALEQAAAAGALIVSSAGNWPEYESEPHYPSDYPHVISVGAVGADGQRAPYSFFGTEVDLAAPGGNGGGDASRNLVSAAPGGGTRADFGTSFAAPLVCGVAALVWSSARSWTAAQVRAVLEQTATTLDGAGLGAGVVSARAALDAIARGSDVPLPVERPGEPVAPSPNGVLEFLNTATLDELVSKLAWLPLTCRITVARRPIVDVAELWPMLGLTREQFEQISRAAAPPQPVPSAAAPGCRSGRP